MPKPTVRYTPSQMDYINVGQGACVFPVDHPSDLVTNQRVCHTSTVLWYDNITGEFETKNTKYVPVKEANG